MLKNLTDMQRLKLEKMLISFQNKNILKQCNRYDDYYNNIYRSRLVYQYKNRYKCSFREIGDIIFLSTARTHQIYSKYIISYMKKQQKCEDEYLECKKIMEELGKWTFTNGLEEPHDNYHPVK